jgi:hypothetical protein
MASRVVIALTLAFGWYLMVPPLGEDWKHNDDAPLRSWKISESFDTAAECREMKISGWRDAKRRHDVASIDEYMKVACIETVDPRLKEK